MLATRFGPSHPGTGTDDRGGQVVRISSQQRLPTSRNTGPCGSGWLPSGENDQRRASTASKIIINKDEIERSGDSSVSEVLKRLPGVTSAGRPGRGGDVRMRGMGGGYTQLLVNGERMPPGFSLDNLRTGNRVLDQHETGFTSNKRDGVNINGRVQLSLGEGESVLFTPFVVASKSAISSESRLDQAPGQR